MALEKAINFLLNKLDAERSGINMFIVVKMIWVCEEHQRKMHARGDFWQEQQISQKVGVSWQQMEFSCSQLDQKLL